MGFAAPLGLLALFALLMPVAIHLLRRRPRRAIQVGSIRHLAGVASARSVRVTEPWLLALRVLLVSLCALVLAEPYMRAGTVERSTRVALVSAALMEPEAAAVTEPLLDSLRSAGAEVRALPAGGDLWSQAREVDAALPEGSSIVLVVPTQVRVTGLRPALRSDVAVRMLDVVPAPLRSIRPSPSAIHRVAFVVADSRSDDARYLRAALSAVADARGDSLEISMLEPDSVDGVAAARGDWIVSLADTMVASEVAAAVRAGALLLTDSAGGAVFGTGVPLEADSPMLVRRVGRGLVFTFRGHFVPADASVALSGALPELIGSIWPDPAPSAAAPDGWHHVTATQLLPSRAAADSDSGRRRAPIGSWLLAAGALLFLVERFVAHRQRAAAA